MLFSSSLAMDSVNSRGHGHITRSSSTSSFGEKGLENKTGENNCFLNVVIQSLYHLDPFRNLFLSSESNHLHSGNGSDESCIFCALAIIFAQFEYGEQETLTPISLRRAMSALFVKEDRFQIGQLDDAMEALDAILKMLHAALLKEDHRNVCDAQCEPPCFIHQLFGLGILEQQICTQRECGASSEPNTVNTFVHIAYAADLRSLSSSRPGNFAELLKRSYQTDTRPCNNAKFCNSTFTTNQFLLSQPKIFTIGFVWDSDSPNSDDIKQTLDLIDQTLDLSQVYGGIAESPYELKGMICYYGKHYDAYFFDQQKGQWWIFDDARVRPVAEQWRQIKQRCHQGKHQPFILFYQAIEEFKPNRGNNDALRANNDMSRSSNDVARLKKRITEKGTTPLMDYKEKDARLLADEVAKIKISSPHITRSKVEESGDFRSHFKSAFPATSQDYLRPPRISDLEKHIEQSRKRISEMKEEVDSYTRVIQPSAEVDKSDTRENYAATSGSKTRSSVTRSYSASPRVTSSRAYTSSFGSKEPTEDLLAKYALKIEPTSFSSLSDVTRDEMRRDLEEYRWRRRPPGQRLTLRCESVGSKQD
eukprot:TRINITY_DN3689_c0_g1_i4.p1 TRINITY_DN3689_c0_g1~~TRINITY_DN3689_c0_g1_i4.p1  ORF type:complete len:590 (+),score=108.12 TRINITY_DN3689_c0_g1_i4:1276-3045(+)